MSSQRKGSDEMTAIDELTTIEQLTKTFLVTLHARKPMRIVSPGDITHYTAETVAQIGTRLMRRKTAEPECECQLAAEAAGGRD